MFGASSTAAPAPFSFSSSQPAQAAPSLFGAQPASAPSLFGAQPASTPSLFGAAPAPAAATAASPFGSAFGTAQPAAGGGLFGQPQQQQLQQQVAPLAFAGAAPQAPDLSAIRELEGIKDSYVPGAANQRYRFQHLLLNVVDNPAARAKPAGVDELQWREALQRAGGADNPDHLWPVLAQGFKDLLARCGWLLIVRWAGRAQRLAAGTTARLPGRSAKLALIAPPPMPLPLIITLLPRLLLRCSLPCPGLPGALCLAAGRLRRVLPSRSMESGWRRWLRWLPSWRPARRQCWQTSWRRPAAATCSSATSCLPCCAT